MGCILALLLVGLGASPSAAAVATATTPSEDDIVCLGAGNGDIQCDVRVSRCIGVDCVWVCGVMGGEGYRPCSLLPIPGASAASASTVVTSPGDDLFCVGWGSGDIECIARVYECGNAYCAWTCATRVEDYPCHILPTGSAEQTSSSVVIAGSGEDTLCFGWGNGDIDCLVRVWECTWDVTGYCIWTCPTHEIDHGCKFLPSA